MRRRFHVILLLLIALLTPVAGWTFYRASSPGQEITEAAKEFVVILGPEQRQTALLSYENDTDQRLDWHFIPKDHRKGLQIKHMTPEQRKAALALLRATLSAAGYEKATQIMALEKLLDELESERGGSRFARDPERYYFTLFMPGSGKRWALGIEGHHLSLNFVIQDGKVISSTPQFFAANPGIVRNENQSGFPVGTRILAEEEQLAFEIVNGLDDEQRTSAVIAQQAPKEIRAASTPQPPTDPPAGIPAGRLASDQQKLLRKLIQEYADAMPAAIAQQRMAAIDEAGFDGVHFAWAGATEPGIGHYYRIQGESFLVEFVNTQPDAAGKPGQSHPLRLAGHGRRLRIADRVIVTVTR